MPRRTVTNGGASWRVNSKKRADPQVRPYSLRAPSPYFEIIFRLSAEIIILPS